MTKVIALAGITIMALIMYVGFFWLNPIAESYNDNRFTWWQCVIISHVFGLLAAWALWGVAKIL